MLSCVSKKNPKIQREIRNLVTYRVTQHKLSIHAQNSSQNEGHQFWWRFQVFSGITMLTRVTFKIKDQEFH